VVVVLALSIATLIDFVEDNFQLNSTLQPTAEGVPGIGGMRTDSAGIFITLHQPLPLWWMYLAPGHSSGARLQWPA